MNPGTVKRLLSYLKQYRLYFIFVIVCILVSSITGAVSSLFLQKLIDEFISPLLLQAVPDFSGLLRAIILMGGIFLIGVLATLFYNRTMVVIAQGVQKKIRDQMFSHMQTLPIKYFDTHTHGDIMSHYTNDIDTLRQMISMSIPQVISSIFTIVAVFFAMLYISVWLSLFVVVFIYVISKVTRKITGKTGIYFVKQQESIGDINGYIEEMINGQKVVKVFCHEEKSEEIFDKKNNELCTNATEANKYANILMPVMNNLGYILYVLIAVAGGAMGIAKVTNISLTGADIMSLGMIASFLQLSRSFVMPIGQVSQQINSIIMALAGADRIFKLLDEKSETDEGYVTLVNAKKENGVLVETGERTELWAWKYPHGDSTVTLTELKGEIQFYNVDFGYEENKIVLHNITLHAKPGQKVALVGATGAGKTTITNLLNRFYDIADGKIRYDGININKIKKSDLRRSLGIVLQDVNLFTGTVMDNIRYGKL
ncbi:MAG TPA: ABC transporter, partial [Clostridiaceae bacterium]|nr:ABC transporter [Clostridiaceae bacterium]